MGDFKKISVTNRSGLSMENALLRVAHVLSEGNVSRTNDIPHPCHVTTWGDGVLVWCRLTRARNLTFDVQTAPASTQGDLKRC